MSETNGVGDLLALVNGFTPEKRSELEKRIEFGWNPRHNAGLASGLAQAVEAVAERWPEAAAVLRELAAVAADYARREKWAYEQADKLTSTPEARAEMDAEIARIESGEAKMIPFEEVLRQLDEDQRLWNERQAGGIQGAS
jgi:hypothetical protein